VARALKGRSRKPFVFTKCERVWNDRREIGKSLKADSIRREVEASLRRLQLDTIDLYQIHWPDRMRISRKAGRRWRSFSARAKCAGSEYPISMWTTARAGHRAITSLQPPYSIVSPEIEEALLPYTQQHGIGVIVYSPMKSDCCRAP